MHRKGESTVGTAARVWRSRPIFISSTFKDFHAERDYLSRFVFPELEERLRKRRCHLEPIDLRWGVDTRDLADEEAKELEILKVCLDEIERSRPFLIALVGDRYGWVPPAERLAAAAQEKGLTLETTDQSVTALEITFGVLADPEQARRSRFYFRKPLPYAEMERRKAAQYCDLYGENGKENFRRLQDLKEKIRRSVPHRVRDYEAVWDADKQEVSGLEEWGRQVLEDLWADMEAEMQETPPVSLETWQDAERSILEQTVARLTRDFVGRRALVEDLMAWAATEASPRPELQERQGLCLVGEPGTGKSALFAEIVRRLEDRDVLVLAHAAGVSPTSRLVDQLLRRWVGELAAFLGEADPGEGITDREKLAETFAHLLARASRQKRVVCLLDALNAFERTPAGRHLTWLPSLWPQNARLIATTLPGREAEALGKKPWARVEVLDRLNPDEAAKMAEALCRRHRKRLPLDVRQVFLEKKLPDGTAAAGYPLWLELAVDQLLLLDEDDFARMEHSFTGSAAEKLHQLLLTVAKELPADIPGLYGFLLQRIEAAYGEAWTREFAGLLAVTRGGLRSEDLEGLLPRRTEEPWDPLRFAHLRRGFRAHLDQRGAFQQWDFAHAQMREAVFRRYLSEPNRIQEVHRAIADHLWELDAADPLRQAELMFHLIGADDPARAAQVYASWTEGDAFADETAAAGLASATRTLAEHILAGATQESNPGLTWVLALPDHVTSPTERFCICHRFLFGLLNALENDAPLALRERVAARCLAVLQKLVTEEPQNPLYRRELAACCSKLGDFYRAQGRTDVALRAYQLDLDISRRLAAEYADNAELQHDLALSSSKLGDIYQSLGCTGDALNAYEESRAIMERLSVFEPDNAQAQRNLAVSYSKLGDIYQVQGRTEDALEAYQKALEIRKRLAAHNPNSGQYQRDLAVSYSKLGDIYQVQSRTEDALDAYQKALEIRKRLAAHDPDNAQHQSDLAESYERLGDIFQAQGRIGEALEFHQRGLEIRKCLAAQDSDNADRQRDLSVSYFKLIEIYTVLGRTDEALDACKTFREILEDLSTRGPENADFQRGLAVSYGKLADVYRAQGRMGDALEFYQRGLEIHKRLAAQDPDNTIVQHDLSVSYERLGDYYHAQGHTGEALMAYEKCLHTREFLAKNDPRNADLQRDIAGIKMRLGDIYMAQGHYKIAKEIFKEDMDIAKRLAAQDPGNAKRQHDVAVSTMRLGDVFLALGHTDEALAAYNNCRDILEQLAKQDPGNAMVERDLALSYSKLGDIYLAQERIDEALSHYQKARQIQSRLAKQNAGDADRKADLALTYGRLGDIYHAQGRIGEAFEMYRNSQEILEHLTLEQAGFANFARPLSVIYERFGDIHRALGHTDKALNAYQNSLDIVEGLAVQDPDNAVLQIDLAKSLFKLGEFLLTSADSTAWQTGLEHLKKCLNILWALKKKGGDLEPSLEQILKWLESLPL